MALKSSVILCTRNRCRDLVICLQSLACQALKSSEIIIIDSSDQPLTTNAEFTALFTAQQFGATSLQYHHTKPGLTYQRNVGISYATGSIIYFFDDDVVLQPDYIARMQEAFEQHPSYAAGMGDISNISARPSRKYQLFRRLFLLPRERASGNFTWSGMPTHPYGTQQFKRVQVLGGCCMAFRRETLQEFKFDESFHGYAYLEDADIARRISLNYPIFFNPAAKLLHNESPVARDRIEIISTMFVYNYSYLFFKNFYPNNKLKIVCYFWSIMGIFLQALLLRNWPQLRGYRMGLYRFFLDQR